MEARIKRHPKWKNSCVCEILYSSFCKARKFDIDFDDSFQFALDKYNDTYKYQLLEQKNSLNDYYIYFFKNTPEAYVRQLQLKGDLPNITTYIIYDVEE